MASEKAASEESSAPPRPGRRGPGVLAAGAIVVALALLAGLTLPQLHGLFDDRARLAALMRGAGPWGPLWLIGLMVAQVIAAPVPGQAVAFAGGYVYGFWQGAFYCWLGVSLGSAAAMTLARLAGRPLIERLVDPRALARLDRLAAGQGPWFFFLIFLLPFLPDDLACFVAGLTALPLPGLVALALVGRIPGVVAAAWLGAYAEALGWQAWLALALVTALGVFVAWRYGPRIQNALLARLRRGDGDSA